MHPIRSRLAALLVIAPLALTACANQGTSRQAAAGRPARGESPAQHLFRAAGDQAVVTMLVDPRRFSELQDLVPFLSLLGRSEREVLRRALRSPSLWVALGQLVHSATPWPADLKGWDPARPLALALFEPPAIDVGSLALAFLRSADQPARPLYLRHRLLIPATDAAELARSLGDLLGSLEHAPTARTPGVYGSRGLLLTINAAGDHVRVELLLNSRPTGDEPPWELLPTLAAPPLAPPPQSAAQQLVTQGDDTLAVYVRPERLRGVSLAFGGSNVVSALAGVEPGMRTLLATKGWAELAGGDLILGGGGGEVRDNALTLSAGPEGPRLTAVLDLTPAGAAAWTAAAQSARRPQLTWGGPVVARFGLTVDLATLLRQAPPAPGLPTGSVQELTNRVKECGSSCLLYLGLRSPLSALRVAATAQAGLMESFPRGGDVVLTALQRGSGQGSLAVVLPETSLVAKLLGQLESSTKPGVQHSAEPAGEGLVLHRYGLDQEPTAAYGSAVTRGTGDLINLEVDFAPLLLALGKRDEELAQFLSAYRGLRARMALSGSSLLARTILARPTAGALTAPPLPQLSGKPAAAEAPQTPGQVCLQEVQAGMVKAWDALSAVDPAQRVAILKASAVETAAAQRCALQDPAVRGSAERMQQARELAQRLFAATPEP